jgi:hypothetical protein
MDDRDRDLARLRLQVGLIERLVLKLALAASSRQALEDWVATTAERLGEAYSSRPENDPAEEVILSEEAVKAGNRMKQSIASVERELGGA